MQVLRKILAAAMLLLLVSNAFGQRSADALLKSVADKTRAYQNLRVDFTYRMINEKAGINESTSGTLFLNGEAYKLTMDGQVVISDGKTVWTYLRESNEVMISNAEAGEDVFTPSSLLTSYFKDFGAGFINERQNAAKGLKTIELKPKSGKKFSKIHVGINEARQELVNMAIFDNGGNTFQYELSKMAPNQVIAKDFFRFNTKDFPGVEVIDMR